MGQIHKEVDGKITEPVGTCFAAFYPQSGAGSNAGFHLDRESTDSFENQIIIFLNKSSQTKLLLF